MAVYWPSSFSAKKSEAKIQSSGQNNLGQGIKNKFVGLWCTHVVNIGCILFKAITYLQSAYRLKGEEAVEANDITEIAGVHV